MTKGSVIAEITDLSQDFCERTRVHAYLHKQEQKFLGRTRTEYNLFMYFNNFYS